MRALVTGASGFVGRAAVQALVAAGHEVTAIAWRGSLAGLPNAERVDLFDPEHTRRLLRALRPTHLLHLAWDVTPGRYWNAATNDAWRAASQQLVEDFVAQGGSTVVAAGTCAEYSWDKPCLAEQTTPLEPASRYGRAKLELGRWLLDYGAHHGVATAWARLFFLYGPHEAPERLVPAVINALLDGNIAACTDGEQQRDFLHVADAADALTLLLARRHHGSVNVSSGSAVKVADVVNLIAAKLDAQPLVRLGARPRPADDPPALFGPPTTLDALGWSPVRSLDIGLEQTIAWWRGPGRALRR